MNQSIYIYAEYDDESWGFGGVDRQSVYFLKKSFSEFLPHLGVQEISAEEIKRGIWKENAAAFIMPGGRDLPYSRKLNGEGNRQIRDYVESGGVYLGFCAGAYYGSSYCNFHRGREGYEVLGDRELAFFKGSAVGPVLADYEYDSHKGARIAELDGGDSGGVEVYFNGGCYFKGDSSFEGTEVLASFKNEHAFGEAAVICCEVGRGKAILSGVHPEYDYEGLRDSLALLSERGKNEEVEFLKSHILSPLKNKSHKKLMEKILGFVG